MFRQCFQTPLDQCDGQPLPGSVVVFNGWRQLKRVARKHYPAAFCNGYPAGWFQRLGGLVNYTGSKPTLLQQWMSRAHQRAGNGLGIAQDFIDHPIFQHTGPAVQIAGLLLEMGPFAAVLSIKAAFVSLRLPTVFGCFYLYFFNIFCFRVCRQQCVYGVFEHTFVHPAYVADAHYVQTLSGQAFR